MQPTTHLDAPLPASPDAARHADVISEFSKVYYGANSINGQPAWESTYWRGARVRKCPLDLWLYQEIIHEQQPDVILECGVYEGGSVAFLADMCRLNGHGHVIGVDIDIRPAAVEALRDYPNVTLLQGSSTGDEVLDQVLSICQGRNTLVILDSLHTRDHVLEELRRFHFLVPPGGYLIVEDSNVNGHPVLEGWGPGPMEAIEVFLTENTDFSIDASKHKFYSTFNPNGYLRRAG